MLQFIKKPTLSTQHMTSITTTKFPCLLLGKGLFSTTLPTVYKRSFSSALSIPSSYLTEPEQARIPAYSWPWMWLDEVVSESTEPKTEKSPKEKFPDVTDEGFISKKEFNPQPQVELETFEKSTGLSDTFFYSEGMSYEDFQGLL